MTITWGDKDAVLAMLAAIPLDEPPPPPPPPPPTGTSRFTVDGVRADNSPINPATTMRMSAWGIPAIDCSIDTDRAADQVTPYAADEDVWFYFRRNDDGTVSAFNSRQTPSDYAANANVAPGFVTKVWAGPTLLPSVPQGGVSKLRVRGRCVSYTNSPEISGIGYPTMQFDFSAWIPREAGTTFLFIDSELKTWVVPMIGGLVLGDPDGNTFNQSLYGYVGQEWVARGTEASFMLPDNRQITATFLFSQGSTDNAVCEIFVKRYTF